MVFKYFLSVSLIVFIWVFGYFNLFSIHLCYAPPPAHPTFEIDSQDISGSVQLVGAPPDLGEPTTEGDNMAIGDEAGPTESYESPTEGDNKAANVSPTDVNGGPTDGSASPTESYESPTEGDNRVIVDEAEPTDLYENPTDRSASPPELGESPAEMDTGNGEALIDLYGPTPSTNTIYPTDIITNKKNHNGPIFSKLQLYNFLNEHHIPFNEQNYILNEFNELNQLSSISRNVSNDTSISKVITEPTHNQVFYGWYPVKGSNDTHTTF